MIMVVVTLVDLKVIQEELHQELLLTMQDLVVVEQLLQVELGVMLTQQELEEQGHLTQY